MAAETGWPARLGWAAARLGWLAIVLAAGALLAASLVINGLAWARSSPAKCTDAACVTDWLAHQQVFGSNLSIALYYGVGQAVEMVPWVIAGVVLFWRKGHEPYTYGFSLMLVLVGIFVSDGIVQAVTITHFPLLQPFVNGLTALGNALLGLFFRFPDGRFGLPPLRWVAVAWVALIAGGLLWPGTALDYGAWPTPWPTVIRMAIAGSVALALLYRYRRLSGSLERQQIKWLVASISLVATIYTVGLFIWPLRQPGMPTVLINLLFLPIYYLSWGLAPVALGVAILRYRLWDIDLILRKTLLYSTLTLLLTLVYGGSVLIWQPLASVLFGSQLNPLVTVGSTLLAAAMFRPLHERAQQVIDRRFFRRRYDSAQALARFAAGARNEVELDQLTAQIEGAMRETLQPERAFVWLRPAPAVGPASARKSDYDDRRQPEPERHP